MQSGATAGDLTFCGQTEANPNGTVTATCLLAGGASITGTFTEQQGDTFDFIIGSPLTISDPGNAPVSSNGDVVAFNNYSFIGEGILGTFYSGVWTGNGADGTEYVNFSSIATSFDNNPAQATPSTVPAIANIINAWPLLGSSGAVNGDYNGQGTLTQYVAYSLNPGDTFTFPTESQAEVPEPGTLALAGALVLLAGLTRKRAFVIR
jgi:hypothetical protein